MIQKYLVFFLCYYLCEYQQYLTICFNPFNHLGSCFEISLSLVCLNPKISTYLENPYPILDSFTFILSEKLTSMILHHVEIWGMQRSLISSTVPLFNLIGISLYVIFDTEAEVVPNLI
ncbi:hypothetical protein BpHYR1_043054 [Brachionus plicatilis]|uniref:Uncharacterized protein n=1 Tax=Brachionus plicatilis TaxID=10195 RepID=A0A3M7RF59_BRAPC|nr:hypothetical protein BpHYR1_043054 [Brachionus plicatilis]